jgi:ribosomal protein S27E
MRHYFCLLGGAEAVIAWLDEHGVKASPSDSGRIAEQVLVSVGGIRGTTLLADRDTLKLLDDMAKSVRRYADGTIEEFEDRAIDVDRWKVLVHRRTNAGPYRWISLDAFVKANVLKLGLSVVCPNCLKMNWVGLSAMSEQLTCERCGEIVYRRAGDARPRQARKRTAPIAGDRADGSRAFCAVECWSCMEGQGWAARAFCGACGCAPRQFVDLGGVDAAALSRSACVALYLNRGPRSQAIHDLNAVNGQSLRFMSFSINS